MTLQGFAESPFLAGIKVSPPQAVCEVHNPSLWPFSFFFFLIFSFFPFLFLFLQSVVRPAVASEAADFFFLKYKVLSLENSVVLSRLFLSWSSLICNFPPFISSDAPAAHGAELANLKLKGLPFGH